MSSVPLRGGAIDLSALKPTPPPPPGSSWVVDVDDRTFEPLISLSMQHPVVVELWSPRANGAKLSDDLRALAHEAGGRYLLARVNVDEAKGVAQALGVQAVPMVVGVIGGQLAPLFQGTTEKTIAKTAIDELLRVAAANGLTGRAQPVPATGDAAQPAGPDPRFEAADAALAAGDFERAVEEFDALLAANPADAEAAAGRAQARLLVRVQTTDPQAVVAAAQASPDDPDAQLPMADLELAAGNLDAAFERLLGLVRRTSGDARNQVRLRLLELFETVGNTDPAVLRARRELTSALF